MSWICTESLLSEYLPMEMNTWVYYVNVKGISVLAQTKQKDNAVKQALF